MLLILVRDEKCDMGEEAGHASHLGNQELSLEVSVGHLPVPFLS